MEQFKKPSKDANRRANSVDRNKSAPKGESDLGVHCLLKLSCPNTLDIDSKPSVNGLLSFCVISEAADKRAKELIAEMVSHLPL